MSVLKICLNFNRKNEEEDDIFHPTETLQSIIKAYIISKPLIIGHEYSLGRYVIKICEFDRAQKTAEENTQLPFRIDASTSIHYVSNRILGKTTIEYSDTFVMSEIMRKFSKHVGGCQNSLHFLSHHISNMFSKTINPSKPLNKKRGFIIFGPSGSGKSLIIQTIAQMKCGFEIKIFNCSSLLTLSTQSEIDQTFKHWINIFEQCLIESDYEDCDCKDELFDKRRRRRSRKFVFILEDIHLLFLDLGVRIGKILSTLINFLNILNDERRGSSSLDIKLIFTFIFP